MFSATLMPRLLAIADINNNLLVYRAPNWKHQSYRCQSSIQMAHQLTSNPTSLYLLDHLSRISCLDLDS